MHRLWVSILVVVCLMGSNFIIISMDDAHGGVSFAPIQAFSGGSGNKSDPFQISDVYELQNMSSNLSAHYILINDINASETKTWNSGAGFIPIGNVSNKFTGSLDGKGFNITDLIIMNQSLDYVGLFGYLGSSGKIINTSLLGFNINGKSYTAGLVGYNSNGKVSNCCADANVSGTGNDVAVLIGANGGTVSNCYATGKVSGGSSVGGLVGGNSGTVSSCYATGNVSGSNRVGGFIGSNSGTVANCYATGNVCGSSDIGGLVGTDTGSTVSNSYYNIDSGYINNGKIVTRYGLYNAQFNDWLSKNFSLKISDYSGSLVLSGGYYKISNVQGIKDLLGFVDVTNYKFKLNTDIDLTSNPGYYIPYFAASEFDGNNHSISNLQININNDRLGLFGSNGGGIIKNLGLVDINVSGNDNLGGLVGSNSGTVFSCYAIGNVNGSNKVGGLVGNNEGGTVSSCNVTANVRGSIEVGGLAGSNSGTVSSCHTTCKVGGTGGYVGGLVGRNNGPVISCYAKVNVTGKENYIGGLLGHNNGGTVSNCYAAGNVSGTENSVGGLVGSNCGTVSYCSANANVSGTYYVGGLVGDEKGGTVSNCSATGIVSGTIDVGGLVGSNEDKITDCYATGIVSGGTRTGGLVGWNAGTVSNCYATGIVSGTSYLGVGGLVGRNIGTVSNCYATGTVSGTGNVVGGLVGRNEKDSTVTNSYATGSVSGDGFVGGLVGNDDGGSVSNSFATGSVSGSGEIGGLMGYIRGTVSNCYATGKVSGSSYIGGLVGNYNGGMVSGCYSTGKVSGTGNNVGGLIGFKSPSRTVTASFWNTATSGQSSSDGGTGKTTQEMKTRSTFTNAGWDFTNLWCMIEMVTYPLFKWQDRESPVADAGVDRIVDEGVIVKFDGRLSSDDIGIASYAWSFLDGSEVNLIGVRPEYPFFNPGAFIVVLKVTDPVGNWATDTMNVTVNDITPPTANAGPDQVVNEKDIVYFDGKLSSDNVEIVNFTWTFKDQKTITLHGINPSYQFNNSGVFLVTLKVSDGAGFYEKDTMTVTVNDITPPSAPTGFSIVGVTLTSISLIWSQNPETDVIGYFIFKSQTLTSSYSQINLEPITETEFIDTGLNKSTEYFYLLKAVDDAELESEFSEVISGSTLIDQYPPVINNIVTEIKIKEDSIDYTSINLYFLFKDNNHDELSFWCSGQEHINITIIQNNGSVIIEPEKDWSGEETVTFYASDGINEEIPTQSIKIIVLPVNDPPGPVEIISPVNISKINDGEALIFQAICSDPDLKFGDELTYTWYSSISGRLGTGEILNNVLLTIGEHLITIEVADIVGETSSNSIKVTVLETDRSDSDHDGLPNVWERRYGLDPNNRNDANQDPDSDGLTNYDEYFYGTYPKLKDTDNDGLDDKAEIFKYLTNATNPDTDGDGYNDGIDLYPLDPSKWDDKKNKTDDLFWIFALAGTIIVVIIILLFLLVIRPKRKMNVKEPKIKIVDEKPEEKPEEKSTPQTPQLTHPHTHQPTHSQTQEPSDIKDLTIKGSIAYSQGNYTDAILAWQQVLELEPGQHPDIEMAVKDALGKF